MEKIRLTEWIKIDRYKYGGSRGEYRVVFEPPFYNKNIILSFHNSEQEAETEKKKRQQELQEYIDKL